jgi:Ca2+-binding RTX toxin-like protein
MASTPLRFASSRRLTLACTVLALAVAALAPASANAFATFSNGVLTIEASEGKIVPRCAGNGEITVSGLSVENGPAFCSELRKIEASSIVAGLFDFSQLPADLGGGQGPIEIFAYSKITDPTEIANDKFIGAANEINVFNGGLGFDSITGGNLNDKLSGGAESDKIEGGAGNDLLLGGGDSDKLIGGPGRDVLKGGGGKDKLIGGPGKDVEKQ